MEFISSSTKFKKYHKIKSNQIKRFFGLKFGSVGILLLQNLILEISNLKFIFKFLKKLLKFINKKLIIKFRYFPHFSITKKPKDIRMGRGKGAVIGKVCYLKKGSIFLEIIGFVQFFMIKNILNFICSKLPVRNKIIFKNNND